MVKQCDPQLRIIGLGVSIPSHMTEQARRAMASCTEIFTIVQEPVSLWLPREIAGTTSVVNALDWYVEGSPRSENYDKAVSRIFGRIARGKSVGYVTYGNPLAYDRVAQNLAKLAAESQITVAIVPGISSVDTILCDLGLDMAPGLQVFEASWLVAYGIKPRVDTPMLLMQVSAFGSLRTHYTESRDGRSLLDLVRHLARFYPATHEVFLVRSTGDEYRSAGVCKTVLKGLSETTSKELNGASLYVPSLREPKPNFSILRRMLSS